MKKKLVYLVAALVIAFAAIFQMSYSSSATTVQSCMGQCKRAQNACVNAATTQGEVSRCNQSYQGCISSCKN